MHIFCWNIKLLACRSEVCGGLARLVVSPSMMRAMTLNKIGDPVK